MKGIEGLTLGRYELRRRIAQGGMAEVYLAYDRRVRRQVARVLELLAFEPLRAHLDEQVSCHGGQPRREGVVVVGGGGGRGTGVLARHADHLLTRGERASRPQV